MPNPKNFPDFGQIERVGCDVASVLPPSSLQGTARYPLGPAGEAKIPRTPRNRGAPASTGTTPIPLTYVEKKIREVRCQLKSRSFRLVQWPSRRVLGAAKRGDHAQTSAATSPLSDATVLLYSRLKTASEGELPPAQDRSALCYRNHHLRSIIMR